MRWFVTDLPFIDGITLINSREYSQDKITIYTVGELPLWAAKRNYDGLWVPPAGLNGKHLCHPEWFATGEPWPTDLPDTIYSDDWIPLCCGRFGDGAQGGFVVGGELGDKINTTDPSAGGFVVGGQAGSAIAGTDPAQGGFVLGGASGDQISTTDATAGGLVIGGAAGDVAGLVDATAGGLVVGGEAGDVQLLDDQAAGGLVIGGAAGDQQDLVDAMAGGLVIGGAAGDFFFTLYVDATAGGLVVGGEAGDSLRLPTAGGLVIGGAAGDVFTPPQPTPGASCAAAAAVNQSQTYSYSISGIATVHWFTFTLPSSGQWHVATTGASGPSGASLTVFSGGSCPSPNLLVPTTSGPPRWVWTGTAGDVIRLRFNAPFSGTANYTFVWDSGP